jgi:type IV fimbrial biogenesis protein FimT
MNFQTRKTHAGFSIVESMMALAIAAILCAVSFPALGGLVHSTQSRVAREAMFASLNLARNMAVSRQNEIVVCSSADGQRCDGDREWQHGWIVFADLDNDGKRDANESILEVVQTQPGVDILSSADRTHITYHSDGTSPGTNATITFCESKHHRAVGTIVVSNAGRARQGNATAEQDAFCAQSDPNA